eukprot:TRINITY_DN4958_c0_g1_i1.p1 TRINITY_DN4958_c0_g1~~TRINITY_DN4958_c0_g1_i1.p1  ORF type:complete len:115 (-),score=23.46 TRINITY_DN4958_c0_g1_i1:39-383(-)
MFRQAQLSGERRNSVQTWLMALALVLMVLCVYNSMMWRRETFALRAEHELCLAQRADVALPANALDDLGAQMPPDPLAVCQSELQRVREMLVRAQQDLGEARAKLYTLSEKVQQ